MADIKALAEELVNLSVKDVQELAQILKDEYGRNSHRSSKTSMVLSLQQLQLQ